MVSRLGVPSPFFFFNDTATTEIYTLSLHDALPISSGEQIQNLLGRSDLLRLESLGECTVRDRKSTRLNSSHGYTSYAVFCLKKKRHCASEVPAATGKFRGASSTLSALGSPAGVSRD